MRNRIRVFFIWVGMPLGAVVCHLVPLKAEGQGDSVRQIHRYIRPCIYFNSYSTPTNKREVYKDQQYKFKQNNLGVYIPLFTSTWYNKDSVSLSSFHLLGITDVLVYKPELIWLNEKYRVARLSAGIRTFYSDGRKSILYFSFTPFISQEYKLFDESTLRYTSAFLYNRTVSARFAYRIGLVKSFTFGRSIPFPVGGVRFGRLDRTHFIMQFPKNTSVNFPMGKSKKVWGSVFSRSMGGIYNVVTSDTGLTYSDAFVQLRRYEVLTGFQCSFRLGGNASMNVGTGFVYKRVVNVAYNSNDNVFNQPFFRADVPPSLFFTLGLNLRLGKAKKVYNNVLMYELFDLNTINYAGNNDSGPSTSDIPVGNESLKKVKYKDVEDLILEEY